MAVLTEPASIAAALERAHGGHWLPEQLQRQLLNLHKAEQQLDSQQSRLLEAYLAKIIALPEFERKRTELAHKQQALTQQQTQLQATMLQRRELGQVADSIEAFCQTIRPALGRASFAQKQQLVQLLIDRVVVTDAQVEIRYAMPMRPLPCPLTC